MNASCSRSGLGRLHLCAFALIFAGAGAAYAHSGGLNSEGCHNNRKTGDYHCHRAQPAIQAQPQAQDQSLTLIETPEPAPRVQRVSQPPPQGPTCFTGPRGGTYTITSSGRKNYGGC